MPSPYILEQISSTKSKKQKLENISERLFREADELAIKAESEKDISLILHILASDFLLSMYY